MSDTELKVKEFWDEQAIEHKDKGTATAPDEAYRELEIDRITKYIKGPKVLDVGCGNGFSTIRFREDHIDCQFLGVDYSEEMIKQALFTSFDDEDIEFKVADVRTLSNDLRGELYDTIISERCIINLLSWKEQKTAILEMKKCLAPGGKIILVENFVDGLENLNELRAQFNLHEIKVRWHNRYLVLKEFDELKSEFDLEKCENIGNLYYIISRVVYAALAKKEGKEPEYEHPINWIASKLPSLESYNCSPNMLYILRTK